MKSNVVQEKSFALALSIIEIYRLCVEQREFVLSKQLLRSGTSIGANVEEALAGQSRADFFVKNVYCFQGSLENSLLVTPNERIPDCRNRPATHYHPDRRSCVPIDLHCKIHCRIAFQVK